jgi:signal transduction histidine kinase
MFRSIFAKYVTAFAGLLLCGFLMLLLVFGNVVGSYAERTKQTVIMETTQAAVEDLSEMYRESGTNDFSAYIREHTGETQRILKSVLTNADDVTIYVADSEGNILLTAGDGAGDGTVLDADELDSILNAGESDLPLSLSTEGQHKLRCGKAVFKLTADGSNSPVQTAEGIVIATSETGTWGDMYYDTLKSVLLAAAWVMIAALIALYFITERTIAPLRDMSRAAKKMAAGNFDTRVEVRGSDEVAQLAGAFNQMAESLQSMDRMRSSFIANISHDLRTPMTTIAGFIDGILDGVIPPAEQNQYLQVVSGEVRRLSRLVNQLLDISRLQAGDRKLVKRPFDICEMGRQILISFEQKIEDKKLDVSFTCEEDRMFVLADQDAVHQIFYNICDNAVKFSCPGGRLALDFSWHTDDSRRGRKAVVRVYNEGQGIPPEDLPYIFERFYKSDKSRSLDKTGVGLGMYIAKTIIEAHGETITVHSEYGKNCEFTFTMPESAPPDSPREQRDGRRESAEPERNVK